MVFHANTPFNELRPHFQERVRRNELLAYHSSFWGIARAVFANSDKPALTNKGISYSLHVT